MAIGAYLGGYIADSRGRKTVFIGGILLTSLFALLSSFSNSIFLFLICRFIVGLGLGATVPTDYTLFVEYTPINQRGKFLGFLNAYFIVGNVILCGVSYLIMSGHAFGTNSWRYLAGVASIPGFFICIIRKYVPESPRYLLASGQTNKALDVLRLVAKINNNTIVNLDNVRLVSVHVQKEFDVRVGDHDTSKGIMTLLRPELKRTTLLLWAIWFLLSYGSWGFMFLVPIMFEKLAKQRSSEESSNLFGGSNLYMNSFLVYVTALGAVTNTYTTEVYPTTVRITGMGMCNAFTRIAGTITPLVGEISLNISLMLTYFTFGLTLIIAAVCCYYLPIETLGMELTENVDDMKPKELVTDSDDEITDPITQDDDE
ncbi:solute carrier family 22 member [Acrasis kona]|uniref:Solute carrier family 22 member n=1 Tax=Acrasis kona TaxID=1008807 RepID=A0AAW2Z6W7_9EUKA